MVPEVSALSGNDVNVVSRTCPSKKNPGKATKKIHKAERERLKRDHLNELFIDLGKAIEPAQQNNGKASILSDATRLLRDLLAKVDCLKKENAALLAESHYVSIEKHELRDENSALEALIEKLQSEVEERIRSKSARHLNPSELQHNTTPQLPEDHLTLPVIDHASPVAAPVFVIPLHHDLQAYSMPDTADVTSKLPTNVSRPHARYPSSSDSWPLQILSKQPKITHQSQLSCSMSMSMGTGTSTSTSTREGKRL